jgi:hypothetical protein
VNWTLKSTLLHRVYAGDFTLNAKKFTSKDSTFSATGDVNTFNLKIKFSHALHSKSAGVTLRDGSSPSLGTKMNTR